jgi:hypothetical protein
MRVDQARHHDALARVERLGVADLEVRPDLGDLAVDHEHIGVHKVADRGIHRNDCSATDQKTAGGHARSFRRRSGTARLTHQGGLNEFSGIARFLTSIVQEECTS